MQKMQKCKKHKSTKIKNSLTPAFSTKKQYKLKMQKSKDTKKYKNAKKE